jgi:hypothetical protein
MLTLLLALACNPKDTDPEVDTDAADTDAPLDTEVPPDTDPEADTDLSPDTDEPNVDTDLPEEETVALGEALDPFCEDLGAAPDAIALLPQFEWISWDGFRSALHSYRAAPDAAPADLGALAGLDLAVRDPLGGLLVSDGEHLYTGTPLESSPLETHITGPAYGMAVAGGDLWVSTGEAFFRWRENALTRVEVAGADGTFLAGGKLWGRPALWVSADGLFGLAQVSGQYKVIESLPLLKPEAMAFDAAERLWVVGAGDLWRRDRDSGWSGLHFGSPITDVRGNAHHRAIWARDADGAWYHLDGEVRPVEGGPERAIGVDDLGRLIGSSDDRLLRCGLGREIGIVGLAEAQVVEGSAEVFFLPSLPGNIASLTVRLDDEALTPGATAPWSVTLRAQDLTEGLHDLTVDAVWEDATTATRTLTFSVGAFDWPTWDDDVEPVFTARCGACHAAGGVASSSWQLDSAARWAENYDAILEQIQAPSGGGSAPMPPSLDDVTSAELEMVALWKAGGFR